MSLLRSLAPKAFCLFTVLASLANAANAETIRVFLIGGQSNADGRANTTGSTEPLSSTLATPQNDVPIYYATSTSGSTAFKNSGTLTTLRPGLSMNASQFGPELSFGRSMADYYAAKGESVALIKYANGGTNLAVNWKAGGSSTTLNDGAIYQNFQTTVANGLLALQNANPTATFSITGMIWMQGESDSNANSAQYQTNLTNFISDIRLTYGANLPFVIGQLSTNQTGTNSNAGGTTANRNTVRAAQAAVAEADSHAGLVVTDTFAISGDNLHFNRPGQVALGSAFGTAMQELVAPTPTPTPSPTPTPTPVITAPNPPTVTGKTTIRTKASKVTVKGNVKNSGNYVQYRLGNSGAFRKASGGAKWKVTVHPKSGRNTLSLRAKDPATGLTSRLKRVVIIRR